jgi:alkylation response protein AidB-like acyl-CoA dehydrogenase
VSSLYSSARITSDCVRRTDPLVGFDLDPAHRAVIVRATALARERFAPRADQYDREARFPAEDFIDLHQAGLLGAAIPRAWGGLGLEPHGDDPFALWMMTKGMAKADLSLARCWEGHANAMTLIDGAGSDAQKRRWFPGVLERGETWTCWSGEPQTVVPGQARRYGTTVTRVRRGYVVNGTKVFATGAGGVTRAILLVSTAGPGAARHGNGPADALLMLACALPHPGVCFDTRWWDPIGMRGTNSHLVHFDDVFIPDEDQIGRGGAFFAGQWQTRFTPQYAASFLGAAEAAFDYALDALSAPERRCDPYIQHHVGHMAIGIETAHLWLHRVARLWTGGELDAARLAGARARYLVEHLAEDVISHCLRACGARSLIRPSPIERIYRDLAFYLRHDSDDQVLATIGRSVLGEDTDPSFFRSVRG